jgi:WD40 repeat protein
VIRFWDAETGREAFGMDEAHHAPVQAVAYTPDGRTLISAGDDRTVRLWDVATGRQLRQLRHQRRVRVFAVSPDGRTLAAESELPEPLIHLWDLSTGLEIHRWPGHDPGVGAEALAFTPDGQAVLSWGRDRILRVRELATGLEHPAIAPEFGLGPRGRERPGSMPVGGVFSFAPDRRSLAVQTMTRIFVADLATGKELYNLPGRAVTFSPDGAILAVATRAKPAQIKLADGTIRTDGWLVDGIELLDAVSGKSRLKFAITPGHFWVIAFAPDGRSLAVATDRQGGEILTYDTTSGRERSVLRGGGVASCLAFAPDGRCLASGQRDTSVLIWDVRATP